MRGFDCLPAVSKFVLWTYWFSIPLQSRLVRGDEAVWYDPVRGIQVEARTPAEQIVYVLILIRRHRLLES